MSREYNVTDLAETEGDEVADDHHQHKVRKLPAVGVDAGHDVHQGAVHGGCKHRQRPLFSRGTMRSAVDDIREKSSGEAEKFSRLYACVVFRTSPRSMIFLSQQAGGSKSREKGGQDDTHASSHQQS